MTSGPWKAAARLMWPPVTVSLTPLLENNVIMETLASREAHGCLGIKPQPAPPSEEQDVSLDHIQDRRMAGGDGGRRPAMGHRETLRGHSRSLQAASRERWREPHGLVRSR